MSTPDATDEPTPAATPDTIPERPREPENITPITALNILGSLGIIAGLILAGVAFAIGDSLNLTIGDLAARIATASLAGVALLIGFIAIVGGAVLMGIREMMRRQQTGERL